MLDVDARLPRFAEAYLRMVDEAQYRAYFIHAIEESVTANEALAYARDFVSEDNQQTFYIGCSHYDTNCAFVFLIEAARLLAGRGDVHAIRLLKMAIKEIEAYGRKDATPL